MEPVEKRRKGKRRRSARVYINANRPIDPEAAALIQEFPSDPDDDDDQAVATPDRTKRHFSQAQRRRLAARDMALPDGSYPIETPEDLHNAAILARSGHGDVEAARRLIARRAKEMNMKNPLAAADKSIMDPRFPGGVDPMNRPGPNALALGHPSMRMATTDPVPLFTTRTDATPFPADLRGLDSGIGIRVTRLDAAAATGLSSAPGNPAMRLGPHIAPLSATPPNGGHDLGSPACQPTMAMKNSDRVALMKEHMFPGSGGRR